MKKCCNSGNFAATRQELEFLEKSSLDPQPRAKTAKIKIFRKNRLQINTVPCLLFCFQMVWRINCLLWKSLKTTQNHPEIEFLRGNWKCYLHQCCFSWRPSWRLEFSVNFKGGLPTQNSSSDFVVCKNFNPRCWDWENHDFRWQIYCESLLRCSWRHVTYCLKWQYYATVVIQIRAAF